MVERLRAISSKSSAEDLDEARQFLDLICGPDQPATFQTYDENPDRQLKDKKLGWTWTGTLDEVSQSLVKKNQLPVQAANHVDRANIMIAGKGLGQSANKRLGLLLGYRRDDGHAPVRPSLANDPVPQKDEPVVDVGDMGLLHIQRQLQAVLQDEGSCHGDSNAAIVVTLNETDGSGRRRKRPPAR